jgi:hypothetical protein
MRNGKVRTVAVVTLLGERQATPRPLTARQSRCFVAWLNGFTERAVARWHSNDWCALDEALWGAELDLLGLR